MESATSIWSGRLVPDSDKEIFDGNKSICENKWNVCKCFNTEQAVKPGFYSVDRINLSDACRHGGINSTCTFMFEKFIERKAIFRCSRSRDYMYEKNSIDRYGIGVNYAQLYFFFFILSQIFIFFCVIFLLLACCYTFCIIYWLRETYHWHLSCISYYQLALFWD